jgi:hypothetical protein
MMDRNIGDVHPLERVSAIDLRSHFLLAEAAGNALGRIHARLPNDPLRLKADDF